LVLSSAAFQVAVEAYMGSWREVNCQTEPAFSLANRSGLPSRSGIEIPRLVSRPLPGLGPLSFAFPPFETAIPNRPALRDWHLVKSDPLLGQKDFCCKDPVAFGTQASVLG
jgi:hypothetical protein